MHRLRRSYITLLLLMCGLSSFAREGVVDSLWRVLQRTEDPSSRFDLYCGLSLEYAYNEPDSALLMLERADALRSADLTARQLAIFHRRSALAYKLQSKYDKALLAMDSSLLLFRTVGDSTEVAKALVNKGAYYQQLDQLDLAFDFFQQGRRLLEEADGEELAQAKVINNLSVIYISWGMHAEAIALLFEAIDIKEQLQDYGSLANSYGTLASLYMARDELEQALRYHEKALEAAEQSGNRYLEAVFLFNLGENYKDLEAYERAETYMREARSIALDINNSYLLGYCVVGLAEVAKERGQLETARRELENSLELDALANSAYMRSNAYLQLAEIALEQGRLQDAEKLGIEGLALAKRVQELTFVSQGEELLAQIYERMGDDSSALEHYKAYKAVQDSILSQRNSERINKLEAQYDHQLEQKDYELQLAATEKQLDRAANQAQRWYMLFVTLGLLVLAGVVAILLYLNRQHRHSQVELNSMNEELYQSNEQLEIAYLDTVSTKQQLESTNHKLQQFVYAASHDFQQHLDGINTASRQLEEQLKAIPQSLKAQRLLQHISTNGQQMEQLINDLLCYYQLAEEAPEAAASTSLATIAKRAESECCAAEIEPSKAVVDIAPDLPEVHVDPKHAQLLLASLMRYAIRHSSGQQPLHLRIGSQAQKGETAVFVQDDGLSVPAEYRQAIFQPFFRLPDDEHRHSSGMELAISARVVSMYGGKIWWEQAQHGHGNRFCFTLPIAGSSSSSPSLMTSSSKKENP